MWHVGDLKQYHMLIEDVKNVDMAIILIQRYQEIYDKVHDYLGTKRGFL